MASAWKVYLPALREEKNVLVAGTPPVSRAFRGRVELAPDQVVAHRPADFVRGQGEAVRHQQQLLPLVGVADDEKAGACFGRDPK